jgi:hydrogenase maturation factor
MPSIDAAISMLSKSMDDQKRVVQMLTDTVVAQQGNAPAKEVLQKVEEAAEEQSATLGTMIDQTI